MGHRTNSSLCVGFMVSSHSHCTIQVITWNDNEETGTRHIYTTRKRHTSVSHKETKLTNRAITERDRREEHTHKHTQGGIWEGGKRWSQK